MPRCRGDVTQINQVFSNLLGNAIKFLDPARCGLIRITGKKKGSQRIYCVEDNGTGIGPEHHKMIFEIFNRLYPDKTEGEGLGLAIISRIIEKHQGKLWLESECGKGSKFYVQLSGA